MKITTTSCSILFLLVIIQIQHILAQEYAKMVTFSIEVDGVPKSMDVKFEDDVDVAARTFCQSIDNVEDSCHKTLAFHIYSQFAEENAKLQRQDISVQYARIMLSLDPENRDAKMRLAKYLEDSGDLNGCIQIYRDMLSQNPNDKSVLLNMATAFHKAGDLDRAVPEYVSLLKTYEREEEEESQEIQIVHNNLGLAYLALGRTDSALVHMMKAASFESANNDDPRSIRGLAGKQYLMSDLQASEGQIKEAADTFLQSLGTESVLMGMNAVAREAMLKNVGVLGNQSTNGVKFSDSAAPPQLVIFCPLKAVYGDGMFFLSFSLSLSPSLNISK